MKKQTNKFFLNLLPIIAVACPYLFTESNAIAASRVAIRGTAASSGRRPVVSNDIQKITTEEIVAEPEPVIEETEEIIEPLESIIEPEETIINKSEKFADILSNSSDGNSSSDNDLAEMIKRQRDSIRAQDERESAEKQMKDGLTNSKNSCDDELRKCMTEKCGKDFTKCALDGDTMFGEKINLCKRDLKCTGEEIKLFSAEIKADRDASVHTASFDKVIECGKAYNYCMITECGLGGAQIFASESTQIQNAITGLKTQNTGGNKCINKTFADNAIRKCKSISDKCLEQDSGLAGRFGTVIGNLRQNAEIDVPKQEKRLYEIRDSIKKSCEKLGAMFDERTFDCVYTVNFFAGGDQAHPMASRKRSAGDTFVCTPEWFGVDVTTYKENAYRETRAQTGASSAMLGSGLGTAAGMITSGAMDRALDRQKAEKELKQAQKEAKEEQGKSKESENSSQTEYPSKIDPSKVCGQGGDPSNRACKEELAKKAADQRRKETKVGETFVDEYGNKKLKLGENAWQDVNENKSKPSGKSSSKPAKNATPAKPATPTPAKNAAPTTKK